MSGHGRRSSVAIAIGAAVAVSMLVALVPNASASSTAPTITLTQTKRGWVNVHWHFSPGHSRTSLKVEIDRGTTPNVLTKLMTINGPRSKSSRYDRAPMKGMNYYRVELLQQGFVIGTSAVSSINESNGGTTATTQATTTTTVQGTTTTTAMPTTTTVKATTTTTTTTQPSDGCSTAIADIERLVNAARRTAGRAPLADNVKLDKAAQQHSTWMSTTLNFSHDGWDTEIANAGYHGWSLIGQNIAAGQTTAASAMDAWMGSAGHKANILDPTFTNMGVGCSHVSKGYGWYWTQDFGNGS